MLPPVNAVLKAMVAPAIPCPTIIRGVANRPGLYVEVTGHGRDIGKGVKCRLDTGLSGIVTAVQPWCLSPRSR